MVYFDAQLPAIYKLKQVIESKILKKLNLSTIGTHSLPTSVIIFPKKTPKLNPPPCLHRGTRSKQYVCQSHRMVLGPD